MTGAIVAFSVLMLSAPPLARATEPIALVHQQDFSAVGPVMPMGGHMVMTELRTPASPADIARARHILAVLRVALRPYSDYHAALAAGDRIFLPEVPQDVYHFVNYPQSDREQQGHADLANPGSLLYVKSGTGYRLVGAMYGAPANATAAELNAIVPLSIASWHVHTDLCLPQGITIAGILNDNIGVGMDGVPGMLPVADGPRAAAADRIYGFMADGRFGFGGRIHTAAACEAAHGHFVPQAFGWMVHVYPFAGDNLKVDFAHDPPRTSVSMR